jgi:hypothetical protein
MRFGTGAIQGHAGKTDAATYRHFDIVTLAEAVAAIPSPLDAKPGRQGLMPRNKLQKQG